MPTIEEVTALAKRRGIRLVELEYVDLSGRLRSILMSLETFERRRSATFDASSVGLAPIEWSDALLIPDPDTAIIAGDTIRLLGEIHEPFGGGRSPKDPRYIAERMEEALAEQGMRGMVGPELEFMVLDQDLRPVATRTSIPKQNYQLAPPSDPLEEFKHRVLLKLEQFGLSPEVTHHEVGVGQSEITVRAKEILAAADSVVRMKRTIKEVARDMGLIATFMPKPVRDDNGSGMHIHMSLWKDSTNLFYDPDDEYAELSQLGRYFIGGILHHIRSLAAIVAPTVNSYKRLIPGYEAPVVAVWSRANRSAAVRVPVYKRNAGNSKRIEFRVPDPSCNPYLAFAASFAAGLDGVRKQLDPGDPADVNTYSTELEATRLPRSLYEAIDALESDNDYLKPVFSSEVLEIYVEMKRREAADVGSYPSEAEFRAYLDS